MGFVMILLAVCIYLPTIWWKGLISDDQTEFVKKPFNRKWSKSCNILTHLAACWFVYIAFGMNSASFFTAMVLALHPSSIQSAIWRAARHYGFNALIFCVAYGFMPWLTWILFFGIRGIGTLTFIPIIFFFTKYWYLGFLLPMMILISWKDIYNNAKAKLKGELRLSGFNPFVGDYTLHKWQWRNLVIVVKTVWYYALSNLLPFKNGFYNSWLVTRGYSQKEDNYWFSLNRHFWGGILTILLTFFIWLMNMTNVIGHGIMLFYLSLAPFLNFITIQQQTAPRFQYISLIGFHIALANILMKYSIGPYIYCFLLGIYYIQTHRVIKIYKLDSLDAIMRDSSEFPDNPRLWYYRYENMLNKRNSVMAWAEAAYGLKYIPYDSQLWFGLACASFDLGDLSASKKYLEESEKYMRLLGRRDMQSCCDELRNRINKALEDKWKK